ncbi:AraC family transcriptional regulator [Agromyces sp. H66]|uniref:AraC family transcriptional regulator n=1 Tax=Agromyces sp. H66 TaxID=2529859 RepID=UPI0010AA606B|nr:AraC family transcriptional regulator [Agromyces sp. H66]
MSIQELRRLIARHAPEGVTETALPGVLVSRHSEPGPPHESTTGTVLAIVAQGGKRIAVGDRVHEYAEGQYLVASVDLPVSGQFVDATPERPALGFALVLRPAVVTDLLLSAPPLVTHGSRRRAPIPPGVAVSDAAPELLDAAVRMLRLLDRPGDRGVLSPMIERELHWIAMTSEHGATVRQLGLADSSMSRVRQAARWIRDRYAETIRIEELARMSQMSTSAFHRNFHAVTEMSPIQFQKQIRLQEARMRLLTDPGDVAGTAYAVGYESPSQFSREYRRHFGAPPGRDAAQLRASARTE